MGLLNWVHRLFRTDPEKLARIARLREESRKAKLESQRLRGEAEAVGKSFDPPTPGL